MAESSLKGRNTLLKNQEITHYEQFLLFRQCFQNCRLVKTMACLASVKQRERERERERGVFLQISKLEGYLRM